MEMFEDIMSSYVDDEPERPSAWQKRYGKASSGINLTGSFDRFGGCKDELSGKVNVVSPPEPANYQPSQGGLEESPRERPLPERLQSEASELRLGSADQLLESPQQSSSLQPPMVPGSPVARNKSPTTASATGNRRKRRGNRETSGCLPEPSIFFDPSSVSSSRDLRLSASGIELRKWIQEVQRRADDDARKDADPFNLSSRTRKTKRRERKSSFASSRGAERKENDCREGNNATSSKELAGGSKQPPSQVTAAAPQTTHRDASLEEARSILLAYSKVEKDAEKVRVQKLGRVGAEDFIERVRRKQRNVQQSGSSRSRNQLEEGQPPATVTLPVPLPPVPEPYPELPRPQKKLSQKMSARRTKDQVSSSSSSSSSKQLRSKSRRNQVEMKKVDAELAKAYETAVKIARQRSRRRVLKNCFRHLCLFITEEAQKLANIVCTLNRAASARVRTNVLRRWRAYTVLIKTRVRRFVSLKNVKRCRGIFSTWVSLTKENRLVLEGFFREAEWRLKGRCFSRIKRFARDAVYKREEAAEQLGRIQEAAKNDKALRWWKSCVMGSVFLNWSLFVKAEKDRKYVETCHERRRGRVKNLFERVKSVEVVGRPEDTPPDGVDNDDDVEGGEKASASTHGAKNLGSDQMYDAAVNEKYARVAQLRSLMDKCLQEEDAVLCREKKFVVVKGAAGFDGGGHAEHDSTEVRPDAKIEAEHEPGAEGGGAVGGAPASVRTVIVNNKRSPGSSSMSTITKSTSVPKSVAKMFSRHEERAKRRAALNARYAVLNNERNKRLEELEDKKRYEEKKREAMAKAAKVKQKKEQDMHILAKKEAQERRREMWKLACMHHVMNLLGNVALSRWKGKIEQLRLKERKVKERNAPMYIYSCHCF